MRRTRAPRLAALIMFAASCVAPPRAADRAAGAAPGATARTATPVATPARAATEPLAFFDGVRALCGQAFEGAVVHAPAADSTFAGRRLVMHVAVCHGNAVEIPFHVGDDRSRTWILRRSEDGLELKHRHRQADGTPSSNTNYGGPTRARGTPHRQEFPADAFSVAAAAARRTQWWFLEHYPGHRFAYGLFRADGGSHYRIEFDLTRPVPAPPAPW